MGHRLGLRGSRLAGYFLQRQQVLQLEWRLPMLLVGRMSYNDLFFAAVLIS